jgi:hypothetical protein
MGEVARIWVTFSIS